MTAVVSRAALHSRCGEVVPLDVESWRRPADDVEIAVLADLQGPVMDVGCGPGRIVAAIAASGRMAMGVDTSPSASAEASQRGVAVLNRSVFDPLPGEERWGAVVMLDGNIGIGGDPVALLARARELLAPGGTAVAEVGEPGSATDRLTVRVQTPDGNGPWFPWARVSADHIDGCFVDAGLRPAGVAAFGGRWFARAFRP
ncbi:MAG: class I SAM-dependent methyltransferase [Acidimicrobiales bacterium]